MLIIFGLIASAALIGISISVGRKSILSLSMVLNIASIAQYVILGSWSAVAITVITVVYIISTQFEERFSFLRSNTYIIGVIVSYLVTYLFTSPQLWSVELVVLVATMGGVLTLFIRNQVGIKVTQIVVSLMFLVFALLVGAYGQVPGQAVNLVLTVVALGYVISYHRANGNVQVPEISTVICNKFRRVRQDSLLMVGS